MSLGLRHVALQVADPQKSKDFYVNVLGFEVEWEPDPDNVYLTTQGQDNLALHRAPAPAAEAKQQILDHIGIVLPAPESVDTWYARVKKYKVAIEKEIKTHRDGARSFYFRDPDGILIQMIYHPPIAASQKTASRS